MFKIEKEGSVLQYSNFVTILKVGLLHKCFVKEIFTLMNFILKQNGPIKDYLKTTPCAGKGLRQIDSTSIKYSRRLCNQEVLKTYSGKTTNQAVFYVLYYLLKKLKKKNEYYAQGFQAKRWGFIMNKLRDTCSIPPTVSRCFLASACINISLW